MRHIKRQRARESRGDDSRRRPGSRDSTFLTQQPTDAQPGGRPLESPYRIALETRLGHQFSHVRVHADGAADRLAHELDARAFAIGDDVFFRAGQFEPHTPSGLRLLAHESAHTVQQSGSDVTTPLLPDVDREKSSFESEAARMGDAAIDMTIAPPSALSRAPVAQVQRWPWSDDEEKKAEEAQSASLWDSVKSAGSTALDYGNAAGTAVANAESAAWSGAKSSYSGVTGAYDSVAPNFTQQNKDLGTGVDAAEAWLKKGNDKAAAQADDSVLGSLTKASAWMNNMSIDAAGGIVKGVGDLTSMAGNAIFHPIDAAGGMLEGALGMAEHVPLIPGLNTTVKGMHGLWDLANGKKDGEYGNSLGELGENLLLGTHKDPDDPAKKSNADVDFLAGIGGGTKAWRDKPAEAATRTVTNLLPMLLGDEAAGGNNAAAGGPPVPEVVPGAAVDPLGVTQPVPSPSPVSPLATTGELPLAPAAVDPLGVTQVDPLGVTQPVPSPSPVSPLATTGEMPLAPSAVDPLGVTQPGPVVAEAGEGSGAAARPKNNVQIIQNIAKSGAGNVEIWQDMLQKGATGVGDSAASAGSSLADIPNAVVDPAINPLAQTVPAPAVAPTVNMPTVPMPGAPTVPVSPVQGLADVLSPVAESVRPPGLAPTVDMPAIPGPADFGVNMGLGRTPENLGLPATPTGSLDVDELIRQFGRNRS
jgi:uncharacterized protein DUF4157